MLTALRLAMGLAKLSAAQATGRIAAASGLFALALLFALIGFTAFTVAFWIWLARVLDPISAALIVGGMAFFLAAILLLVARSKARRPTLFGSPAAQHLLDEFKANRSTVEVWAPLVGVALLGFLLGGKSKD